jgi:ERCC4-type nuclease
MAKSKTKKRNPVIEQAKNEAYSQGFKIGLEHGRGQTTAFFLDWMDKLQEVPGIGSKTASKIANHFLAQYGDDAEKARQALRQAKKEGGI